MEMSYYKIGIMNMNIHWKSGQKKTSESTDCKKSDKTKSIKHRCVENNSSLIETGHPIKNFNRRRDRNQITKKRKDHTCKIGLATNKHMVAPYQKTQNSN